MPVAVKGAVVAALFSLASLWLVVGAWSWALDQNDPEADWAELGAVLAGAGAAVLALLIAPLALWVGIRAVGYPGAAWTYAVALTVLWPLAVVVFAFLLTEPLEWPRLVSAAVASACYASAGAGAARLGTGTPTMKTALVGGVVLVMAVLFTLASLVGA